MTPLRAFRLGRLALRFGEVYRATLHADGVTPESDTTHTVMLGLLACEVASEVEGFDVGRVAQLALVHDLVEAYVGDTNSFDISPERQADKAAREAAALERLRRRHRFDHWMLATLEAYEAQEEPEARLVRYLDKATPKICHALNQCASIRAMGKTRDDLIRAHREQYAALGEQYPEIAEKVGYLLHGLMVASELAWPVGGER